MSVGNFGISEGIKTGQKKKKKNQNMHLTATTSGEVAQTLLFTSREWGLVKEVWASLLVLRVRTGLNALRTI